MKYFSAQFILTNSGPPLKRSLIKADDDGTILSVENTEGNLKETRAVEFYNGIIIPGFVNCHCHLELSHLKGAIPKGTGLAGFLTLLQNIRNNDPDVILSSVISADKELYREGVELCADICNDKVTFTVKMKSPVRYLNLLEVFATDPGKAAGRMSEIIRLSEDSEKDGLPYFIVPHTVYTVSLPLFRLLREKTNENRVTSIHFMETKGEDTFVSDHSGPLMDSLLKAGMLPKELHTPESCVSAILNEVTPSGSLILVHNTYTDRSTIKAIQKRKNTYWCLCPDSNKYIENKLPPVDLLTSEGCDIVIGTDSLASNTRLSIISELKTIQENFPAFGLEEIIRWATLNGAKALGEDQNYGKIEPGMRPGLLLLENVDLINFKLLPETSLTRLL